MTVALDDARSATLGASGKALQHRRGINVNQRTLQIVHIGAVIVLRVRDRRLQQLAHELSALLGHELQCCNGVADRLAAHDVGYQPALLRGDAGVPQNRGYLHVEYLTQEEASTLRSPEWVLNVRVGANSPNLWPTMFSVTSTGMCWRPLCTAIVSPTMSGMTIERRDQVLIGLRSFLADATCTFFARCRSTNGPFLSERGMCLDAPISGSGSCGAERSYCPCACCDGS